MLSAPGRCSSSYSAGGSTSTSWAPSANSSLSRSISIRVGTGLLLCVKSSRDRRVHRQLGSRERNAVVAGGAGGMRWARAGILEDPRTVGRTAEAPRQPATPSVSPGQHRLRRLAEELEEAGNDPLVRVLLEVVAGIVEAEDVGLGKRPQPQSLEHLRPERDVAHGPCDRHRLCTEVPLKPPLDLPAQVGHRAVGPCRDLPWEYQDRGSSGPARVLGAVSLPYIARNARAMYHSATT